MASVLPAHSPARRFPRPQSALQPGAYAGPWLQNISVESDLTALIIPLGAHHLDLMFMDDADPPEATYARQVESAAIDRWVS